MVVTSSLLLEAGRLVVLVEVRLEREALVAAFAAVLLQRAVRLHVRAQVGAVGERLACNTTCRGQCRFLVLRHGKDV